MKNLFTLFTLLFLFSVLTKAQTTITASDFESQLAIGKKSLPVETELRHL